MISYSNREALESDLTGYPDAHTAVVEVAADKMESFLNDVPRIGQGHGYQATLHSSLTQPVVMDNGSTLIFFVSKRQRSRGGILTA